MQDLAPLDWIGIGITAFLLAMGLLRGLWWQVIRFTSVVLSAIVARVFAGDGASLIGEMWSNLSPRVCQGFAWVGIFVLTLTAATLLGHLGQKMIDAMQLGFANRVAGGAMGALTGLSIHMALLLGISLLAPEPFVDRHIAGTYSEEVYQVVGDRWQVVLGADAAGELRTLFSGDEAHAAEPLREDGEEPEEPEPSDDSRSVR